MTPPPSQKAPNLETPGLRHGFFGRAGGVSTGGYASLNTGPGSNDAAEAVRENRARCITALSADKGLVTAYQIHSAIVHIVDAPWPGAPQRGDALVTTTPGLAVGALAADCMPFLFADPENRVVAAAHAGWRGALAGVLENTIETMVSVGAARQNIRAALGPCLRQHNFEVGLDLVEAFTAKFSETKAFFAPGATPEKRQFDLAAFGRWRLSQVGVENFHDLEFCTLGAPADYFSYRAAKASGGADYGRNLSAILLAS